MALINTKAYPLQMDKTIDKMFYEQLMRQTKYYNAIFKEETAPKGPVYTEASMSELEVLREVPEGGAVDFVVPAEGRKINRYYKKYGLGVQMTKEAVDDDLFGNWKKIPGALADSAIESTEILAADVLNSGFSTQLGADGLALFHDAHTLLNSTLTLDNLAAVDLDSGALEAAFQYGDGIRGDNGFLRPRKPIGIVVPAASKWAANELLKATGRVWNYTTGNQGGVIATAANAYAPSGEQMNRLNPSNGIVDGWKIFVNPYLTDSDSWFVLFEGFDLRCLWKYKPTLESTGDFATGNKVYKTMMRASFFCNNSKFMWGSTGAG